MSDELAEVRAEFLDDLLNEDDQQLFELFDLARRKNPAASTESNLELARAVLFQLLSEGSVELVHGPWPDYGPAPTPEELERLRNEETPWADPTTTDLRLEVRARRGA